MAQAELDARERIAFDAPTLPKDVWGLITKQLPFYDVLFLRATSSWLYKYCKQYQPFPKFFVLDQDKCMEYLAENGFISLLDYVKHNLHFEWTDIVTSVASRSGQVATVKHLIENGCPYDKHSILLDCVRGTCDLNMIKYLHGLGVDWHQDTSTDGAIAHPINLNTVMEFMAYHGHVSCMKYAIENGCNQRVLKYTPTTECLDFAIQHRFQWKDSHYICEEAARRGNLTILKYAHQNSAQLFNSAAEAAREGYLDCLMYAAEHATTAPREFLGAKTLDCFEYLFNKYPQFANNSFSVWLAQLKIGNFDILRYMAKNDWKFNPSRSNLLKLTGVSMTVDIYRFLIDEMQLHVDQQSAIHAFTKNGDIEGLKLALAKVQMKGVFKLIVQSNIIVMILKWDKHYNKLQELPGAHHIHLLMTAMQSRNIDMVEFIWYKLHDTGRMKINNLLRQVQNSTVEIADFLTQNGAKWTDTHLEMAADNNLPIMAYLRRLGCEWPEELLSSKHICAKYARDHGCKKLIEYVYK